MGHKRVRQRSAGQFSRWGPPTGIAATGPRNRVPPPSRMLLAAVGARANLLGKRDRRRVPTGSTMGTDVISLSGAPGRSTTSPPTVRSTPGGGRIHLTFEGFDGNHAGTPSCSGEGGLDVCARTPRVLQPLPAPKRRDRVGPVLLLGLVAPPRDGARPRPVHQSPGARRIRPGRFPRNGLGRAHCGRSGILCSRRRQSADTAGNLAVFDQLVELFQARADIPGEQEFPEVEPRLPTYRFPSHVLTAARLARALDAPRLTRLRRSVATAGSSDSAVRHLAPWHDAAPNGRLADMVLSQAVLEHVDELAHAYRKMYDLLKPGGVMSHVIDFRCHGSARDWNGHWTYSDWTWKLVRGRRPYFLNRAPCSTHVSLLRRTGFDVTFACPRSEPSAIGEKDLASRFREGTFTPADLVTSGLFVQAVKPLTTA